MNLLQIRSIVEQVLGYYDYEQQPNQLWTKTPRADAPGWYYQEGVKIAPATFVFGRQRVPANWDVKGLEAVIREVAMPRFTRYVGMMERMQAWTILLSQFDETKTAYESAVLLGRHFGGEATIAPVAKMENDLADRMTITVTTCDYDLDNWPVNGPLNSVPSPIEASNESPFDQQ